MANILLSLTVIALSVIATSCNLHKDRNEFRIDVASANLVCPGDRRTFDINAPSDISCLVKCKSEDGCVGISYQANSRRCVGCRSCGCTEPTSDFETLPDSVFYRLKPECPHLEDTVASSVSGNMNSRGAKAIKTCKTGFVYPDANTSLNIDCDETGKWKPTNGNWEQVPDCVPTTCKIMKLKSSTSMEYDSFDEGSKEVVKVFCAFEDNGGYTYISSNYLRYVTDPSKYYTIQDHVMLRHKRSDGTQWQGRFSILSLYRDRYNVTIRVNNFTGFSDRSHILSSNTFILIGLVDLSFGSKYNTEQGYTFESYDASYTHCDGSSDNDLFLVDTPDSITKLSGCPNSNNPVACTWVEKAASCDVNLPEHYFYYYSMFMGGCGTRMNKIKLSDGTTVTGAAVGLGF